MSDKEGTERISYIRRPSHTAQPPGNTSVRPPGITAGPGVGRCAPKEPPPPVCPSRLSLQHSEPTAGTGGSASSGVNETAMPETLKFAYITAAFRLWLSSAARCQVARLVGCLPLPWIRRKASHCRNFVSTAEIRRRAGESVRKFSGRLDSHSVLGIIAAVFIVITGLVVISWLIGGDRYAAETKLLFFCQDPQSTGNVTLEREVELLRDFHFLTRNMRVAALQGTRKQAETKIDRASGGGETSDFRTGDTWNRLGSTDFDKWLGKNLAVDALVSGGMAKVTLRVQGEDPEYLKKVLDWYVPNYAEYRRNLQIKQIAQHQPEGPRRDSNAHQRALAAILDQLQRIELQKNGCELALQLIDSDAGVFSGFVPENAITGAAPLASFQEKIIQLAIKKKALEVKFQPGSREIRTIQQEIEGVKSAMRECVAAHLEFLKKGKTHLLAQQKELVRKNGTVSLGIDMDGTNHLDLNLGSDDSWFLLQDGLYLLRDRPSITRTPVLARVSDLKNTVAAFVWASPDPSRDRRQAQRPVEASLSANNQPWPNVPATTPATVTPGGDFVTAADSFSRLTAIKKPTAARKTPPRVTKSWSHSLW
jgi:hypothetical protein